MVWMVRNSVVRLTGRPDMTKAVCRGQQQHNNISRCVLSAIMKNTMKLYDFVEKQHLATVAKLLVRISEVLRQRM